MRVTDIRTKYFNFFEARGHSVIPSASLIPENDPTTLFTGSGMQPLLPYLLGSPHPQGSRLADSQKCFRAEDIEEVGDNRHTTFFEMLGNWSLGDYFKEEQLPWFFTFLTDEIKLDPTKLYVTVFAGDETTGIPRDEESVRIWKELFASKGIEAKDVELLTEAGAAEKGMQGGRIFYYDAKKNWWSRAGAPEKMPAGEPGGPDSEVFYDFGTAHDTAFGKECHPNCDCGRFMEIGNSVFMEYIKQEDGSFAPLPQKNVDFGGGLERITAASLDNSDVFTIDTLAAVIEQTARALSKNGASVSYTQETNAKTRHSFRVIADHARAAAFLMADGVLPSNTDQGYFARRLLRRTIRHIDLLGEGNGVLKAALQAAIESYGDAYPALEKQKEHIFAEAEAEEERFRRTLSRGLREFERMAAHGALSGEEAFTLFSTYGFPIEVTEELAKERGIAIDTDSFQEQMKTHQEQSRAGAEKKFKGGLADHSEKSVAYHTATHLLHQALRTVLGEHVYQKGSNITPERLRFDFSHPDKMTDEQKKEVEKIVNEQIAAALPVTYEDIPLEEAKKRGAIGLFEEKYGDHVRVYKIGDFSLEFCGGPHVENTKQLGHFTITKEEAASAGVRRIKAVLA